MNQIDRADTCSRPLKERRFREGDDKDRPHKGVFVDKIFLGGE